MLTLITLLFAVSVTINIILVWYLRKLLQEIAPLHERTGEIRESLDDFVRHVEGVYELPLFYGDQTIKSLLEQSKIIVGEVKTYKNSFIFESEGEIFEEAEAEPDAEE